MCNIISYFIPRNYICHWTTPPPPPLLFPKHNKIQILNPKIGTTYSLCSVHQKKIPEGYRRIHNLKFSSSDIDCHITSRFPSLCNSINVLCQCFQYSVTIKFYHRTITELRPDEIKTT